MPLIDNRNQTLQEALKNALASADRVDITVGFFTSPPSRYLKRSLVGVVSMPPSAKIPIQWNKINL